MGTSTETVHSRPTGRLLLVLALVGACTSGSTRSR